MQNFELSSELFAALIGVALTLLLGAIGWFINSNREHSKWKREQKLQTYSQITNLYYKILSEARDLNDARRTRKSFTTQMTQIYEEMQTIGQDLIDGKPDQEKRDKFDALHEEFKECDKKAKVQDENLDKSLVKLTNYQEELEATAGANHIISSSKVQSLLTDILASGEKDSEGFQYLAELDHDLWTKLIAQTKSELGFTPLLVRLWRWGNTDIREMRR